MPTMGKPISKEEARYSQIAMNPGSFKKQDEKSVGDKLNELAGHKEPAKFVDRKTHNQLGKDDFLKLLTTQLANQDPSSPMDSKAFSTEMAQFASLEQMTNMNTKLEKMASNTSTEMKSYGASFLGKEISTRGTTIDYKGEGNAEISFALPKTAKNLVVRILDEKGQITGEMRRENFGKGTHSISWDGTATDGAPAGKGLYTIQVDAFDETLAPFSGETQSKGVVTAVRFDNGETILELDGQKSIALRDVENFRIPSQNKSMNKGNPNMKEGNNAYAEALKQIQ